MHVYRTIGDAMATVEARDLADRLVSWHDAMVRHLRVVTRRGPRCGEDCPHAQARQLWAEATAVFGDDAARLSFLRAHAD